MFDKTFGNGKGSIMKKSILILVLAAVLLMVLVPAFADDDRTFWSNFNTDPVKNGPKYFISVQVKESEKPVAITRIRTYHWNSGNGAAPGTICVYEGNNVEIGCWQAVGRSAYGTANVYWEALTDLTLYPGHSYRVKVSDPSTWSYNEASKNCGMFELYGQPSDSSVPVSPAAPAVVQNAPVAAVTAYGAAPAFSSGAMYKTGDIFTFGRYEQDNDLANGSEFIEWQVLTVQNDRALVISRYGLDVKSYIEMAYGSTWESGTLRSWLNDYFYNIAFTQTEQAQILLVTNDNPNNPQYGTPGGNPTTDRIFLLSIGEAERYFSSGGARKVQATAYAKASGIFVDKNGSGTSSWFLRSPGSAEVLRAVVTEDGSVDYAGPVCGIDCDRVFYAMRPAFWIRLAKPAPSGFTVTYHGNNCLSKVPTDHNVYLPGQTVTVLFSPVEYMDGKIFLGWDMENDGYADFGYAYDKFTMPKKNVDLYAVCYIPIYDYDNGQGRQQNYGTTDYVVPPDPVSPNMNGTFYITDGAVG